MVRSAWKRAFRHYILCLVKISDHLTTIQYVNIGIVEKIHCMDYTLWVQAWLGCKLEENRRLPRWFCLFFNLHFSNCCSSADPFIFAGVRAQSMMVFAFTYRTFSAGSRARAVFFVHLNSRAVQLFVRNAPAGMIPQKTHIVWQKQWNWSGNYLSRKKKKRRGTVDQPHYSHFGENLLGTRVRYVCTTLARHKGTGLCYYSINNGPHVQGANYSKLESDSAAVLQGFINVTDRCDTVPIIQQQILAHAVMERILVYVTKVKAWNNILQSKPSGR